MSAIVMAGAVCGLGSFLLLRTALGQGSTRVFEVTRLKLLAKSRVNRRILGVADEIFVARLLAGAVGGASFSALAVLVLAGIGIDVPLLISLVVILCGAVAPCAWVIERITKMAADARRTFSYALSSYLDLASVLLAGGAGSETALNAAASTGSSWSFRLIRGALEEARASRLPSWQVFGNLGREYGVVDLERLAGSMQLAGEQGAKVRASLAAQADALRTRQIAEIEADAQAATERMGVPTVLLFVGFIALLGYPALDLVVGQM